MPYPWEPYFRLGLVVSAFFRAVRGRNGPVAELMQRFMADSFFQAIEFSGADDPVVQQEIRRITRSGGKPLVFAGASYCSIHQLNLHDLDEKKRHQAVQSLQPLMDEAIGYGCRIFYVMGSGAPPAERADEGREQFIRSLLELCDYARQKDPFAPLTLSVENFPTLRDVPSLIGPTREVAELLRRVRSSYLNVGLTFDTSHILQLRENLLDTYFAVRDVIAHLHLSNCLIRDPSSPFYGDKHPPYGLAGSEIGIAEIIEFLKGLRDAGHFDRTFPTGEPILSMEVITPEGRDPESTLEEAKAAFLEAWNKFEKSVPVSASRRR
jgi:sugar phosphate isomerase/epimerase